MKETIEEVWALVQAQAIGLKVETDSPNELHRQLTEYRSTCGEADLFQFTLQVRGNEVWVVRSKGLPQVKTDGAYQPMEE